jgi:hypothetical protein
MKILSAVTIFHLLLIEGPGLFVRALSTSPSEVAARNLMTLQQSLSSMANKLTLSPEIIIPEPTDPTALLLQSTEVTKLSHAIRIKAKANAAFVSGSINSLKIFCKEQETARGNFPGPLPVIYCESSIEENFSVTDLADAGAAGYLYSLLKGEEVGSADDLTKDNSLKENFDLAIQNGLQLIPEVVLKPDKEWNEEDISSIVNAISEKCGSDPAAVVFTVGKVAAEDEGSTENSESLDDNSDDSDPNHQACLPRVPKDLAKKIPILGSVRAVAGDGRMGAAVALHKEYGFKGCVLRCDCLPGYRMNPDLNFVSGFWGAAIGDLKSTKSKSFNFRSTIALDRDIPMEWYKYQKNVMESGALGSPGGDVGDPLDTSAGDYKGF